MCYYFFMKEKEILFKEEALAVSNFYYTKPLIKDYYKLLFMSAPQFIFLTVLSAAMMLYALISSIKEHNFFIFIAIAAVCALLFLFVFLGYKSTVKKSLARFLTKQEGREEPNRVYLLNERIAIEECDDVAHSMPYGEVEKVLESGRIYLIAASGKRYVFLPKDSFIKGSATELFIHLKSHYPKIKLRVKKFSPSGDGEIE